MKAREASEVKSDPARSVDRAGGFGFYVLLLLLVGFPCGAQTAQSGEIRLPVLSNSLDGRVIGAPEDAFLPVWKPIESNNGEVSYVDMKSIERGAAGMQVQVYTSVPNTIFDMDKLKVLAFDCQGHFMPFDEEGMTEWMDAPPRSVAGEIAETVCVNQSVPQPAQSAPDNSLGKEAQFAGMQPFTSADGHFSVLFPGTPQQSSEQIHLEGGKVIIAHMFSTATDNGNVSYNLWYFDFPTSVSPQVALQRVEKAEVAERTLVKDKPIDLNGVPGRAFVAFDSNGTAHVVHEFLNGSRMYEMEVIAVSGSLAIHTGPFQNSFRIF